MRARAMLYCQHLAGIGHLIRSTELARALSTDGWDVLLVVGGDVPRDFMFPPAVKVEQLEALQTDPEYKTLSTCGDEHSLNETKVRRTVRLLALFDAFAPDALITEMYPFGRKKFEFELLPLLERARNAEHRPLIAASVRDILVRKRDQEAHERRVLKIVNHFYDVVLVHSDELMQPLQTTYGLATELRPAVMHTGYVVADECGRQAERLDAAARMFVERELGGEEFIVVSCGSGRLHAGQQLTFAALEAAPAVCGRFPHRILICAGPLAPADIYARYERMAAGMDRVCLVHDLPFLRKLLERAALSVSLGGYNTVMELQAARAQALVHAAEPNGDSEQRMRVESLAAKGQLRALDARDLQNGRLAGRIEEALIDPLQVAAPQMDGAKTSAQILKLLHRKLRAEAVLAGAMSRESSTVTARYEAPSRRAEGRTLCA